MKSVKLSGRELKIPLKTALGLLEHWAHCHSCGRSPMVLFEVPLWSTGGWQLKHNEGLKGCRKLGEDVFVWYWSWGTQENTRMVSQTRILAVCCQKKHRKDSAYFSTGFSAGGAFDKPILQAIVAVFCMLVKDCQIMNVIEFNFNRALFILCRLREAEWTAQIRPDIVRLKNWFLNCEVRHSAKLTLLSCTNSISSQISETAAGSIPNLRSSAAEMVKVRPLPRNLL